MALRPPAAGNVQAHAVGEARVLRGSPRFRGGIPFLAAYAASCTHIAPPGLTAFWLGGRGFPLGQLTQPVVHILPLRGSLPGTGGVGCLTVSGRELRKSSLSHVVGLGAQDARSLYNRLRELPETGMAVPSEASFGRMRASLVGVSLGALGLSGGGDAEWRGNGRMTQSFIGSLCGG